MFRHREGWHYTRWRGWATIVSLERCLYVCGKHWCCSLAGTELWFFCWWSGWPSSSSTLRLSFFSCCGAVMLVPSCNRSWVKPSTGSVATYSFLCQVAPICNYRASKGVFMDILWWAQMCRARKRPCSWDSDKSCHAKALFRTFPSVVRCSTYYKT